MKKYINIGIALSFVLSILLPVYSVSAQTSPCSQVRTLVGSVQNLREIDLESPYGGISTGSVAYNVTSDYIKSEVGQYYASDDKGKYTFLIQSKKSPTENVLCIVRPENQPDGYVKTGDFNTNVDSNGDGNKLNDNDGMWILNHEKIYEVLLDVENKKCTPKDSISDTEVIDDIKKLIESGISEGLLKSTPTKPTAGSTNLCTNLTGGTEGGEETEDNTQNDETTPPVDNETTPPVNNFDSSKPQKLYLIPDNPGILDWAKIGGGATGGAVAKGLIFKILDFLLGFVAILAVIMITYAGFLYITATGEDEKSDKARKTILWSSAGLVLVILAETIVQIVFPTKGSIRDISGEGSQLDPSKAFSTEGEGTDVMFTLLNWLLGFLSVLAVIVLIYGGFLYLTAGGESDKQEKATKLIIQSVIGIVIILSAFAIVNIVIGGVSSIQ